LLGRNHHLEKQSSALGKTLVLFHELCGLVGLSNLQRNGTLLVLL